MTENREPGLVIGHEKSRQWPRILVGEIPEEVDVFFLLWMDKDSKRFVSEGFYLSTSEGAPPNTDPFVAGEITVPVVAPRTWESLKASYVVASELLARAFVNDPSKKAIFEQYVRDRRELGRTPKLPVERVDPREFDHLFGRALGRAKERAAGERGPDGERRFDATTTILKGK